LLNLFTTFQKDLSVFLSVIQFSKNNLEISLPWSLKTKQESRSVGKRLLCTFFSLERRWSIPTFS